MLRKYTLSSLPHVGVTPAFSAAPIKRTAVERQVNVQIVFLFILLLALSIGSTIGSSIREWVFSSQQWYLF